MTTVASDTTIRQLAAGTIVVFVFLRILAELFPPRGAGFGEQIVEIAFQVLVVAIVVLVFVSIIEVVIE